MLAADANRSPAPTTEPQPTESNGLVWREMARPIEGFLTAVQQRQSEQIAAFDPEIAEHARYALSSGGKQMRPSLVALSGLTAGSLEDGHVELAVIIEMVHLATLVHDDVMDHADLRRGRPTLATRWGNHVSVLLGDCLFAHALKMSAGFPTTEICRQVAQAANIVCAGEILQTNRRFQFDLNHAEYLKMVEMKTAAFFSLACDLGGLLGGGDRRTRKHLEEYGRKLGIAYQIYDDCLDLFGSEANAGKSLGTDLAGGKLTLPMLLLRDRAPEPARRQLRDWIQAWHPDHWPGVQALLQVHGTLETSREVIHQHVMEAREQLAGLPHSAGRTALEQLTELLLAQTDSLVAS